VVAGKLGRRDIERTVDWIAAQQLADGNVPWRPGDHTDPWNLVEVAMALDAGEHHDAAGAAYDWLAAHQRPDGAWHMYYVGDDVEHAALDTNFTTYLATGVWHHHLATDRRTQLSARWPVVEAAVDFALAHQRETGELAWRGDDPDAGALLTGSSSAHRSLRCAAAIAEEIGTPRPGWELAADRLAEAIVTRPDRFVDKSRFAMDWYYPVLGGVLTGAAACARIADGWDTFVVEGRGVRCVSDRPWVTAAETCELVLTLLALDDAETARRVFEWAQFLRTDHGGYWTGANFEGAAFDGDGTWYPREQTTYTAAAVVLAADAFTKTSATARVFRESRPAACRAADVLAGPVRP
jgi:hypothetical protein